MAADVALGLRAAHIKSPHYAGFLVGRNMACRLVGYEFSALCKPVNQQAIRFLVFAALGDRFAGRCLAVDAQPDTAAAHLPTVVFGLSKEGLRISV